MNGGNKACMNSNLLIIKKCTHGCDGLGWCFFNNVDLTILFCSPEQQELFLLNIHMIILHDLPAKVVI